MKMNDSIFIIGRTKGHLELSVYNEICGYEHGKPPSMDFDKEIKMVILFTILYSWYFGRRDASEGGIIMALAELCIKNKLGIQQVFLTKLKRKIGFSVRIRPGTL